MSRRFVEQYFQRFSAVLDACCRSEAATVSYFYPSKVQSAAIQSIQAFFAVLTSATAEDRASVDLETSIWYTLGSFLISQLPRRGDIDAFVARKAHTQTDAQSHSQSRSPAPSATSTPAKATSFRTQDSQFVSQLNYTQRIQQQLFTVCLACPPAVAAWVVPSALRTCGALLLLAVDHGLASQPQQRSPPKAPPAMFEETLALIEGLCWGVVFKRSEVQRLNGSDAIPSGSGFGQRSANPTTRLAFEDPSRRREFVHAFAGLLTYLCQTIDSLCTADGSNSNTIGSSSSKNSFDVEGSTYLETIARWAGELVQDCVCLHDAGAATELLQALIPASSACPRGLHALSRVAWGILHQYAQGATNTAGSPALGTLPSPAPNAATATLIAHRRTDSTTQKLHEASESLAAVQHAARASLGSRHRQLVEAYLQDPSSADHRLLLMGSLRTLSSTSAIHVASPDEAASLRSVLPSILRLIASPDLEVRVLVAEALHVTLLRLGVLEVQHLLA